MAGLVLYNYYRSSTSVRTRAALNLKGLEYEQRFVHLRKGEQSAAPYLEHNPQGLVPTLILADGSHLTQSLAIIEYLDEVYPEPPFLPADPPGKARVRALSYAVACEIHPINNLKVLNRVRSQFGADDEGVTQWFRHWVVETFGPLEQLLKSDKRTGAFCHGDRPTLADLCLFAQVVNNARFQIDMAPYPTIARIHEACLAVPAFEKALPGNQPDAE